MTKLKQNEFKSLVKECVRECLREIIAEQVDQAGFKRRIEETVIPAPTHVRNQLQRQTAAGHVTNMNASDSGYINPSDRLKMAAQNHVPKGDPMLNARINQPQAPASVKQPANIMASIFEDTMRTTLVQQQAAEGKLPTADRFAAAVDASEPGQLFEGASNWANLAFVGKKS